VKVGDLVRSNGHYAIVIHTNANETLIRWLSNGTVSDARNYSIGLEVISESR
jgi:ribosomal protein L2